MTLTAAGFRSWGFWLITAAATANYGVMSGTSPLLNRGVTELLGFDTALAGSLVSIAGFVGMATMPGLGYLAGRFGPRRVTLAAAAIAVAGVAIAVVSFTIPGIAFSRIAYGLGNAGITVATTAWVSATSPEATRGRALGYYGMSVWIGLAIGPVLAENSYAWIGNRSTWALLLAVQAASLLMAAMVREAPTATPAVATTADASVSIARAVSVPAAIAVAAWGAQGVITTFVVAHLESAGVPATGVMGGASVLLVFAASVLIARVVLGAVTDSLGPARAARASLVVVAAGLVGLAWSPTFAIACLSAVVMGFGYAPLYPSLTMLATTTLDGPRRATAIGWFSAFTSAGMSLGALAGGFLIGTLGTSITITLCAVVQLAVIPTLARAAKVRAAL
ncbi:MFS transporter [Demequina sp. NBRC 110051]|uniref:MFS transporter n=1 Tax=Demequina sp. NBRC 110051 TaxID=1570340 RepID=UPI001180CFB9|nr:MFS transporter [Demequina sp. NBRC 110051]